MPTYHLARFVYVRLLAFVFFAAFLSAFLQNPGLVGSHGLLPAQHMVDEASRLLPEAWKRIWIFPTFCWVSASDASLSAQCLLGMVAALAALCGLAPGFLMTVCWALYLSLTQAGQEFYRWPFDSFLLECGLLSAFLAPWRRTWFRPDPMKEAPPSTWETALALTVLFKCLFLPGLAHLTLGDSAWPTLTALSYQFWTQPLPTSLGLLLDRSPSSFLKLLTTGVLFIEIASPLLFPFTARFRRFAFFPILFLALGSAWTGDCVWGGALLLGLALWTLDDASFPSACQRRFLASETPDLSPARRTSPFRCFALALYSAVLGITFIGFLFGLWGRQPLGSLGTWIYRAVYPSHSFNAYLPTQAIPTKRSCLFIEGSPDGLTWKEYGLPVYPTHSHSRPDRFRWKMHRLDAQMALAAGGDCQSFPFLAQLCASLAQGDPDIQKLFKDDPFPQKPPLVVRIRRADLRPTSREERAKTGAFWEKGNPVDFCPEIRLPK